MVKEKADRIYDIDGFKKRAACVCVKNENENEVLLISSSRNNGNWIVPGGGIESNENPEDAAAREVYEEAGVKGRLSRFLGVFESINRKHRTSVYILIVDTELDDWEEHTKLGRKRKWFNLNEAKQELEKHKPVQGTYINLLKGYQSNNNATTKIMAHSYFNNHPNQVTMNTNAGNGSNHTDITSNHIIIQNNTDNKTNEFNHSNMHYNQLISALTNHHHTANSSSLMSPYSYNSPHVSAHLDHDILSNNNTTSLINSNTI